MEERLDQHGAYATKDQQPTIQSSVVALFDMLGFTSGIRNAQAKGASNELLRRFAVSVQQWYPVIRDTLSLEDDKPRLWDTRAFSDNVVIGQPIRWGGEPELGYMMADLAYMQLGLVLEGFFLRGGIAVGELYMDEDLVFGVGILDAYDAERAASAPRVLLHETAVAEVRKQVGYYTSVEGAPHNEAILVDEDGGFFLNYLDAVWPDRTEYADYSALQKHHEMVVSRLREFEDSPTVLSKYEWAARYHNYFCHATYGAEAYLIPDFGNLSASRLHEIW
jgi:hypothetical protein